jgi:hypothetical protein
MSISGTSIGIALSHYYGNDSIAPFIRLCSNTLLFVDRKVNIELCERSLVYQKAFGERYLSGTDVAEAETPSIKSLALVMTQRLKMRCPECETPGWGTRFQRNGYICTDCGLPTKAIQSEIRECTYCRYSEEIEGRENIQTRVICNNCK